MSTLEEVWPFLRDGFELTITLLVLSMIFSTVLGTVLAAMRVSPVAPFRLFGAGYVNIFRNTSLSRASHPSTSGLRSSRSD